MLQDIIWNELKCTMDKEIWEETGETYEDLPVKMTFAGKEEGVSFFVMYPEDLVEEEVCEMLQDFLGNWDAIQAKVLKAVYEVFGRYQEMSGEESELDINSPEDMKEYLNLTTMIVDDHPTYGLCVGLGFGEEWDIHFDDYEDVGVLIAGGEVVEVGSSEIMM